MQTIPQRDVLTREPGDWRSADQWRDLARMMARKRDADLIASPSSYPWRNLALFATGAAAFLLAVAALQFLRAERAESNPPPRRISILFESPARAPARAVLPPAEPAGPAGAVSTVAQVRP